MFGKYVAIADGSVGYIDMMFNSNGSTIYKIKDLNGNVLYEWDKQQLYNNTVYIGNNVNDCVKELSKFYIEEINKYKKEIGNLKQLNQLYDACI